MESQDTPEVLQKDDYEEYTSYVHLTKESTKSLRDSLKKLGDSYINLGRIGIMTDKFLVIEIPVGDDKNCMQITMKEDEGDFKIFHSLENKILELDVNLLMMRIGGVSNSNILTSFPKNEIRFLIDDDDKIIFG